VIDLTDVKESGPEILPQGEYVVIVESAEVKSTKNGTGEYINAKLSVDGGHYHGKHIYHMFNIKNDSVQAVEIGLSQLKSLMKCAGCKDFKLQTVKSLEGLKVVAVVKIKVDAFGEKNIVSFFKPCSQTNSIQLDDLPF
jgi:hypothetical protein